MIKKKKKNYIADNFFNLKSLPSGLLKRVTHHQHYTVSQWTPGIHKPKTADQLQLDWSLDSHVYFNHSKVGLPNTHKLKPLSKNNQLSLQSNSIVSSLWYKKKAVHCIKALSRFFFFFRIVAETPTFHTITILWHPI